MTNVTHMLVASDLTEQSRPALQRAIQLKQQLGAQVTLLHVVEPGLPPAVAERRSQEAVTVLRQEVNDAFRGELRRFSIEVLVGERFGTIVEQAETRGADLIVLGGTTKRRWRELFVGTTTERVVRLSSMPVLVVSRAGREPYKCVLAAFDASPGAGLTLGTALSIAPAAEFRIVHAWQEPLLADLAGKAGEKAAAEARQRAKDLLDREIEEIKRRVHARTGLEVEIVEGNPYFVMREQLARHQPDLLAMGTHARGGLGTALIGSLARELLTETSCDVLVARP